MKSRAILVTGAGRGIGKATIEALQSLYQGPIVALSRSSAPPQSSPSTIHHLQVDLSEEAAMQFVLQWFQQRNWSLTGVVHNAAAMLNKPFSDILSEELHEIYKVNVYIPFLLNQTLFPLLEEGQLSHVVHISSMGGVQGSAKFPGLSAYSSSKGALTVLTECLAEEWKGSGVSCNALALGAVDTEMLKAAFPGYKAPVSAEEMGAFIARFVCEGHRLFNGKVLPVSSSTP
jgi:NAD(P)-dependent dehydrogenase (short-subunit alcohol dehydrogenase family)